MAKIFKTNNQEKALKEIVEILKIISSINKVLTEEEIENFKIKTVGNLENGALNETIPIPFIIISTQLRDYKKRLVKEVLDKSKEYNICLEEEEKKILGIALE